jgi:ethanolamine ammonia-lyase large subunit
VAGFIGPEVFRSREQLVRCCLEDIVMGKLHGLMIGLDVCSTLHMDVSLDDLGWCIDQIMPANPGYLMALPTRIDPMLGYLTTGYQDHVNIARKIRIPSQ